MSRPKEFKVFFTPHDTCEYVYVVEAKNEDEAYDKGRYRLIDAIGYDASKDWVCSDVRRKNDG